VNPKYARYTIRRDAFGWSVIDVMTGLVVCRDSVTLTGLSVQDDLADSLSWLARRDEERRDERG
jgi:hypothetical protein